MPRWAIRPMMRGPEGPKRWFAPGGGRLEDGLVEVVVDGRRRAEGLVVGDPDGVAAGRLVHGGDPRREHRVVDVPELVHPAAQGEAELLQEELVLQVEAQLGPI